MADAIEDAARFGFAGRSIVARFKAEESVFESKVKIVRFEAQSFAELLAGSFTVAGFQECVAEIFVDVSAAGRAYGCLFEVCDRGVIIVLAQFVEGFGQRFVSGIFRFQSQRGGCDQKEGGEANWSLPLA